MGKKSLESLEHIYLSTVLTTAITNNINTV